MKDRMKYSICTIALSGLLAIGMSAAASAQDAMQPQGADPQQQGMMQGQGGMRGMDPDEQLAHMTKRYHLSADQQTQLKPVLADHQQQMMQLRSDSSMSREDKRSKMESMQQDHMQKVEAVLTADQKTKFESDMAKMKARRAQRMQDGGGMGGPPDGDTPPPPPAS